MKDKEIERILNESNFNITYRDIKIEWDHCQKSLKFNFNISCYKDSKVVKLLKSVTYSYFININKRSQFVWHAGGVIVTNNSISPNNLEATSDDIVTIWLYVIRELKNFLEVSTMKYSQKNYIRN